MRPIVKGIFGLWVVLAACVGLVVTSVAAMAATSGTQLTSVNSDRAETELGSLIADAIREQVKADISLVSASELKEVTISAGSVSVSDVSEAVTYQNDPVVVLTLRGEQIRRALERSVAIHPQKNLGFLQVSGLTFSFDPARPKESRVLVVQLGQKPLDDNTDYTVAVGNSLANGALGYFRIWNKDQISSVTKTTIVQAIERYLSSHSKLDYADKKRIVQAK